MNWSEIIGFLAPGLATLIVQGLKKLMKVSNIAALVVVAFVGALTALIGVGPVPEVSWLDTVINAGWVIGLSTFIYSLFKKRPSDENVSSDNN